MKDNLTNDSFTTKPNAGINISGDVISRLREGNHAAFEKIFNLFYPKVNLFIKTLTKNDDMAEELTQQVFVNLWINREKADPGRNFSGYIYTMAKNATLRAIQQQMRFEANEFDYNEEADNRLTDDELIVKETELLVDLTVAAMPPKRRQVYRMSRHENKTNEEIANELNISRKVVEKHLRLAINELKEAMSLLLLLLSMNYFFKYLRVPNKHHWYIYNSYTETMKDSIDKKSYKKAENIIRIYTGSEPNHKLDKQVKLWLISNFHKEEKEAVLQHIWNILSAPDNSGKEKVWEAIKRESGLAHPQKRTLPTSI